MIQLLIEDHILFLIPEVLMTCVLCRDFLQRCSVPDCVVPAASTTTVQGGIAMPDGFDVIVVVILPGDNHPRFLIIPCVIYLVFDKRELC
jgi:hypothetical protein